MWIIGTRSSGVIDGKNFEYVLTSYVPLPDAEYILRELGDSILHIVIEGRDITIHIKDCQQGINDVDLAGIFGAEEENLAYAVTEGFKIITREAPINGFTAVTVYIDDMPTKTIEWHDSEPEVFKLS